MPLEQTARRRKRVMRNSPWRNNRRGGGGIASNNFSLWRVRNLKYAVPAGLMLWIFNTMLYWPGRVEGGVDVGVGEAPPLPKRNLRGGRKDLVWIRSDSQPFNEASVATKATHLIIVAGHSVLISGDVSNAAKDDNVWWLYDYQKNRGLPRAIVSHIQAGIKIALEDESSLLMFSGGETRARTGPETEGGSYFRVADALELWDGRNVFAEGDDGSEKVGPADENAPQQQQQSTVRARTTTEEYATDSFQNLLFSICRFYEITGSYPQKISVVSFTFKRKRFETLHASALRLPSIGFDYVGVDPPASTGFDLEESTKGERDNSLVPYTTDPYGCYTEVLQAKRRERNPFARRAPYELTCPDLGELLRWCGPDMIEEGKVPW